MAAWLFPACPAALPGGRNARITDGQAERGLSNRRTVRRMAIRISGPYKGFFITAEALCRTVPGADPPACRYALSAYVFRRAPSNHGRGMRISVEPVDTVHGIADAFLLAEHAARAYIDLDDDPLSR
jgi:hypothetical protein